MDFSLPESLNIRSVYTDGVKLAVPLKKVSIVPREASIKRNSSSTGCTSGGTKASSSLGSNAQPLIRIMADNTHTASFASGFMREPAL